MINVIIGLGNTKKFYGDHFMGVQHKVYGVNDIAGKTDWWFDGIFCFDMPDAFSKERLHDIVMANEACDNFYTIFPDLWRKRGLKNISPLELIKKEKWDESTTKLPWGTNSPFEVAAWLYASGSSGDNIVLYGADYGKDHKYFKHERHFKRVVEDFIWLKGKCEEKGIGLFIGDNSSRLNKIIPKWKQL